MAKYWCYFLFLLWFSYLIVCSVLLFSRGFLLSRITQKDNSTCTTWSSSCVHPSSVMINVTNGNEDQCLGSNYTLLLNDINRASLLCLPAKAKVVLIIVDALRYDFTTYDKDLQGAELPFQNKLPVIDTLLKSHPNFTRLYKFIADPPTTTMQRLNALTTGSLPTFIDAGSNFATSEISEDNLIDQLIKHHRKVIFMGDDTWVGLYPNRFTRSYPFPSFDVRDLDTVDIGVVTNLYPELKKNDFSLLIAHFLGVDHCGHRYGPYHSEMSRKLNEMNEVIENVINEADDDTIVIVIGDHGMTETGDHGGESDNEVTSAMFVHSKMPLKNLRSNTDTIKQVDLVPTLSILLGVPIPFSNLGTLVIDSLPISEISDWKPLLFSLWANVQQMVKYIDEYFRSSHTFSQERIGTLHEKYSLLNARIYSIKDESDFERFANESKSFMVSLRQMCEEVWVEFDSFSISRGMLLLFLTLFFVYMIIDGIPSKRLPEIFMSSFLLCSYTAVLIAVGISCVLYFFGFVDDLLLNIYFSTGLMSLFMLVVLVVQNWDVISLHWYERSKKNRVPNFILRLILIFATCGVFSNSYIVEECYVLLFLLVAIVFFDYYNINIGKSVKSSNKKIFVFFFLAAACAFMRLSMYFWRCREEQQWCLVSNSFATAKAISRLAKVEWTITLVSLAVLVTVTRIWLRNCGNLVGYTITVIFARYVPTVIVVCTGGYWVLHHFPKDTRGKVNPVWQADILIWVVYLLTALGFASILLKPLCVYVIPKKNSVNVNEGVSVIPQLFNQVKGLFNAKLQENDEVPIVCGLATVYSAIYVIVGVYFCLLWALLLGNVTAPAAVLTFFTASLLVAAMSITRIQSVTEIDQLFEIPGSTVLVFVILSQYFFYGSGHQPTFPNIAWEAAFIGTSSVFKYNFIPATLIIINTFGSNILVGLLLPLVLIAPFSLFIVMPSVVSKKSEIHKDYSRGEILLYERSGKLLKSVFILCCKYIICHSIKVFVTMLASTIHCRHLMVWKIFAPKLIFESIGIFVTLGSVLVGYLLLIQVHHNVDRLVGGLNKQSR